MNLRDLREHLDRISERVFRGDTQRAKLVIVCVVAAGSLLLLGITLARVVIPPARTRALETPGWVLARELNGKLNARPAFADTGFVVESERPLKLKLVGGVRTQRDLTELREFVKQLRPGEPEDGYEFAVEVIK